MTVDTAGPVVSYRSRRRWPRPSGASSDVAIEVGDPFATDELTDRDHWLTARYQLFSASAAGLRYALAEHDPWRLYRATLLHVDTSLIEAAGLRPVGAPIAHWSPGVAVRVGYPHRLVT